MTCLDSQGTLILTQTRHYNQICSRCHPEWGSQSLNQSQSWYECGVGTVGGGGIATFCYLRCDTAEWCEGVLWKWGNIDLSEIDDNKQLLKHGKTCYESAVSVRLCTAASVYEITWWQKNAAIIDHNLNLNCCWADGITMTSPVCIHH